MILHARRRCRCIAVRSLIVAGQRIDPDADDSTFEVDYAQALDLIRAGHALPDDDLAGQIGGHVVEAPDGTPRWMLAKSDERSSEAMRRASWIECPPPFA